MEWLFVIWDKNYSLQIKQNSDQTLLFRGGKVDLKLKDLAVSLHTFNLFIYSKPTMQQPWSAKWG